MDVPMNVEQHGTCLCSPSLPLLLQVSAEKADPATEILSCKASLSNFPH